VSQKKSWLAHNQPSSSNILYISVFSAKKFGSNFLAEWVLCNPSAHNPRLRQLLSVSFWQRPVDSLRFGGCFLAGERKSGTRGSEKNSKLTHYIREKYVWYDTHSSLFTHVLRHYCFMYYFLYTQYTLLSITTNPHAAHKT